MLVGGGWATRSTLDIEPPGHWVLYILGPKSISWAGPARMWPLSLSVIPIPHILNPKARHGVDDDSGKSSREETEDGGM